MKRYRLLFQVLVVTLLVVAAGWWYRHQNTASRPAPEAAVRADVVPASRFVNVRASEDFYAEQILRHPEVVKNYVELAQLRMQQARETGDEARYVPQARDLLEEALRRDPDDYHALVLKASLLATLHQFEQARALAEQLIARQPYHAFNYGTLVDALVELGRYEEAVRVCDELLALRPELSAYARASYLRQLHGDTDGAIEAMRMAADAGVAGHEDRAWALFQLGTLYLGQNRPDTAAFLFNGILDERPGYPKALAGLAHVRLVQGAYDEAVALLEEAYALAPIPGFLEALADAYAATGDTKKHAATLEQIQQAFRDARAMGENVDMEYADFLAEHDLRLDEALKLARRAYERRPGHLHALETYAWALFKNDRAAEAVPFVEQAMRLNTGDAMVHFRAGMIYRSAGQPEAARAQFEQALRAHLHVESRAAAAQARALLNADGS